MKKIILLIIMVSLFINDTSAQVFNTGQTLKKGVFSVGIEPAIHLNGGADGAMLYVHAGYGVKKGMDIAITAGLGRLNARYVGANIEFAFANRMSFAVGAHESGNFGLDGTFLFDIPIKNGIAIYLGLDSDLNFGSKINALIWIPVGVEIVISERLNLLFESCIGINTYHIIGGGVNFYF